ncbi:MAG TPA: S8 family serine peptidase [Mycobacteriales bacterium]|nr:S8 family serine peptidase [Mycobacteriales bacterium]
MRTARLPLLAGLLAALFLPLPAQAAGTPPQATWHSTQIRLAPALKAGWTGKGVVVAVLDGWVDTSHVDFQRRARYAADCTGGACTATSRGRDGCGQQHGTHVAGSVASSSYGVAPGATLLAIRVLKAQDASKPLSDCVGDPKAVAAGINWAVAHGAQVLNLSLGPDVPGQTSTGPIAQAVAAAAASGAVVVFSAGNADLPVAQAYGNDALVVAATGPSGRMASYSQHGQGVSVAAPGGEPIGSTCNQDVCVTSLYPSNQIAVAAGTSMAAPQVAGLAALLLHQKPGRSRSEVVDRITSTARPLSGAGHGLVDVTAALGVRSTTASPAPRRTTATHRATPSPTRTVVKAATSPSPIRLAPTSAPPRPSVTASPTPTPLPVAPAPVTALDASEPEEVPRALAGLAGALIGLAGAGALLAGMTRKR